MVRQFSLSIKNSRVRAIGTRTFTPTLILLIILNLVLYLAVIVVSFVTEQMTSLQDLERISLDVFMSGLESSFFFHIKYMDSPGFLSSSELFILW